MIAKKPIMWEDIIMALCTQKFILGLTQFLLIPTYMLTVYQENNIVGNTFKKCKRMLR